MSRTNRAALAITAVTAAFLVWITTGWGGPVVTLWVDDLAMMTAAATAAVACAWAFRRGAGRAWALFAGWTGLWALGQGVWNVFELGLDRPVPFPSMADVFFLAAVPCALVGLLMLPAGWRATTAARSLVDGLMIAGSFVGAAWGPVLAPLARQRTGSLEFALGLAYPVLDIVLAIVALWVAAHALPGQRRSLAYLVGGVVSVGAADAAFGALAATGRYETGNLWDAGWVLGFLLVGVAAIAAVEQGRQDRGREHDGLATWLAAAPYFPLAVLLASAALEQLLTGGLNPVIVYCAVPVGILTIVRQVLMHVDNTRLTDRLRAEAARNRATTAQLCIAQQVAHLGSWDWDLDTGVVTWSDEQFRIFGMGPGAVEPSYEEFIQRVHPDDRDDVRAMTGRVPETHVYQEMTNRIVRPDGEVRWIRSQATVVGTEAGTHRVVGTSLDVTEARLTEASLAHQAGHDMLTGSANRVALVQALDEAVPSGAALVTLDLDSFKDINDGLGHDVGDLVLQEVARRLRAGTRPGDLVARVGGDEFAVLLRHVDRTDVAERIATTLLASVQRPLAVSDITLHIGAAAGIAVAGGGSPDAGALLRQADVAMQRARRERAALAVYRTSDDADLAARISLVADLRAAIDAGDIGVHFQPKIDVATGAVVGVEALARWTDATRGPVSPSAFIPLAEQTGLIVPLTRRVLDVALEQMRYWRAEGIDIDICVNLSPRVLLDDGLVGWVSAAVAVHDFPARRIVFEITENSLAEGDDAVRAMTALRQLGVRLAVDDLGTGYSSLLYLKSLPIDELKVDRAFIRHLADDVRDQAIVTAIVALGRALGLTVVAEGVEDEASLEVLRRLGCPVAQGYHCCRPMPGPQLTAWLAERDADFWTLSPRMAD